MSKSEQIKQQLLNRIKTGTYGCDLELFRAFGRAVVEEALEEKKKQAQAEKAQADVNP